MKKLWYQDTPCVTCHQPIGLGGVFIVPEASFCPACSMPTMWLFYWTLFGDGHLADGDDQPDDGESPRGDPDGAGLN